MTPEERRLLVVGHAVVSVGLLIAWVMVWAVTNL